MKHKSFLSIALASSFAVVTFMTPAVAISSPALTQTQISSNNESPDYATAADLAAEYVSTSYDAWTAKTDASQARAESEAAKLEAIEARNAYTVALDKATAAREDYETKRMISVNFLREMIKDPTMSTDPSIQALTMSAGDTANLAHNMKQMENVNDLKQKASMDADAALLIAEQAEQDAQEFLTLAEKAEQDAAISLEKAKDKEIEVTILLQQAQQVLAKASSDLNSAEIIAGIQEDLPASQRILTDSVTQKWNEYSSILDEYSAVLPEQNTVPTLNSTLRGMASRAFTRGKSPDFVLPLFNEDGTVQVGAGKASDGTILLSQSAIDRVETAMGYLGTPYSDLTCQALVSKVSGYKKTKDLNSLFSSAYQNKSIADTLPGDIVFFADAHGITQAGVSIGGGLVIASSAASKSVVVIELGENALISTRPGVDYEAASLQKAPTTSDEDSIAWECGGLASSFGSVSGGAWVLPYGDREYETTVEYGDKDTRFTDDTSPGMRFASKKKAIVQSAFAGVVTVKNSKQRGTTITLRYNDNLSVKYSGLSDTSVTDGTFVGVGDPIALTGKSGSLFRDEKLSGVLVEVLVNNEPVDPDFMFFPPEEAGSMGYPNGLIPAEMMCPIDIGAHMLRCDAAQGFKALNIAFENEFKRPITITDSYRSLESQKRLKKQKPVLAATPGKSNHGWGLAVDLGGGINTFGTVEYNWMLENAPLFGWQNPEWAQQQGSKPEAWHFEFSSGVQYK